MSVHYKFKSALDFDTIAFDGLHISVDDLKKAILHQKRLGKTVDFDLQITNAQTKEGKRRANSFRAFQLPNTFVFFSILQSIPTTQLLYPKIRR